MRFRLGIAAWVIFCVFFVFETEMHGQGIPEFTMSDTTITECSGILFDSGGPNGAYGNNENITTVISPGGVISLSFQGFFQLENNQDFLKIYNGPSAASPLLGSYTGTSLPPALTANSGSVTLVMTSNASTAYGGFTMEWSTVQPMPNPPGVSVASLPVCGSNELNLNLSSPVNCQWLQSASVTLFLNAQAIYSTSVTGNCDENGMTNQITASFPQSFSANCSYSLQLNISIPDNCATYYPFVISSSFLMTNCELDANITATENPICKGSCTKIKAEVNGCNTYTYSWSHGLPVTAGPHQVCPSVTTTYTVTIVEQGTGVSVVKEITIEVPEVSISTPAQTVCQSAASFGMQAESEGEWWGNGIEEGTNIFNPENADAGVNYVYFEAEGCVDSVAITILPIQTEGITAACPGSSPFQLIAEPNTGSWNGPHTTAGGIFNPVETGSFEVVYTLGACTDTTLVNVDFISGVFDLDSICSSIPFDTIAFSPAGGVWSGAGIVNPFLGVYSPGIIGGGDFVLNYAIHGCSQDFSGFVKEIKIGDKYQTSCPSESPRVMYNDPPIPSGGYWEGEGIIQTSSGLFNPFSIPANTWTYIVYHAPNGCSDTTYIYNQQTFVEVSSLEFCEDDLEIVLNDGTLGSVQPAEGQWSGAGISQQNGDWIFSPSEAGAGQYTLTYTANNCSDQVSVKVYPNDLPDSVFEFCSSDDAQVLIPGLVAGGSWSGQGIANSQTGLFNPSLAGAGDFFVYWESPLGCKDSVEIHIEEFLPAAISNLLENYCSSDLEVVFSASPAGGELSGDLDNFSFNPAELTPGEYTVIYTYNPEVCPPTTDEKHFTVHPPLSATMNVADTSVCHLAELVLSVSVTGGNSASGYDYQWSAGSSTTNTLTLNPTQDMTVSVEVSDGCSEPFSVSAEIHVLPPIEVQLVTSDAVCAGEIGWVTANVLSDGEFTIKWDGILQDTVYAYAGTTHQLLVTDVVHECTYNSIGIIDDLPPVVASFIVNPEEDCISDSQKNEVIFIDVSQGGTTGVWNFGNGQIVAWESGQTITQSYPGAGNYTITLHLENDWGCESIMTRSLCIMAESPIFIPDIFSPNGDGYNDILYVRGVGINQIDFRVYNRWGEMVFSTQSADTGWNGNHRGQPAPTGSYFYSLKTTVAGETVEMYGEIALIR